MRTPRLEDDKEGHKLRFFSDSQGTVLSLTMCRNRRLGLMEKLYCVITTMGWIWRHT